MNILELMTWPVNKYRIWCWKYLGIALCSPRDNPVHLIRWSTKSSALEVHELQCIIQELSCSFFFFFQPQLTGTILWVTSVLRIWTTTLFSLGGRWEVDQNSILRVMEIDWSKYFHHKHHCCALLRQAWGVWQHREGDRAMPTAEGSQPGG